MEVAARIDIPFLDLLTPHVELEQELTKVFHNTLRTAGFIGGPMVERFEKDFADFCTTSHSVAVSSGTDALRFAIMVRGLQPGDIIVTVPRTLLPPPRPFPRPAAHPEFVDIDERTYNMSPERLREYLEKQCTMDPHGQTHQPSQRTAAWRHHSGAYLRTNGGYGRDPGPR